MGTKIQTIDEAAQVLPRLREHSLTCWCGQDLEYVRRTHCPRCGSGRRALVRLIVKTPPLG